MGVILSVVIVVAVVLLYDYFTAVNWQLVTSSKRNDIVFEKRNKEYGAYTLRKNYDKLMIIVMLSVILTIGLSFAIMAFVRNMPKEVVKEPEVVLDVLDTKPAEPEEELPPPPKEVPPPPQETTVAFNPPVIVDIDVEENIKTQDDLEDKKASNVTQEGNNIDPFAVVDQGTPEVVEVKKEEKIEEPLEFVEEEAAFVGGSMQKWISENVIYPDMSRELGEQGKVYVEFVVEKDGSITGVRVVRGDRKSVV